MEENNILKKKILPTYQTKKYRVGVSRANKQFFKDGPTAKLAKKWEIRYLF